MAVVLNELLLEGITIEELERLCPTLDKTRVDRLKLSGMPLEENEFKALNEFNVFLKEVAKITGSIVPMAVMSQQIEDGRTVFDAYLSEPQARDELLDWLSKR